MGSVQPTRSWSTYFPRPGSSSGRPGSSSGRSSSGRPGSSGSIASNIIAAIRTNDPSPPILEGQELSESPLIASLPASAPTTVQGSDQPKRSWTNYIPRPRSSSGRPGSSGSMASSIITAIRTNDPSPTVRDGQELPDSPLTPPLPASVPTTGQRSVQPKRSWTNYIPRPRSSSGRPGSSGSMASSIITAIRTNDPSPTIREGQELSESPLTPSLPTSVPTTVQGPDQPKRSWTNYIPRPRSSSGRPGSSGSMASSIITAIRTNDPSPTILEGQELLGSPLTPSSPASVPTTVQGPDQPKHSWTNYIPRPRSSSGRPGSSGSMVSNTITAIRSNDTSPTILEGQKLSGSPLTPSLPASVPTTVQGPVQPKHSWTHYIPRPRSSSGRPGSSGSMVSNIITAIRSNDASPPTLEGQELSESPLTPLTPSLPAPEPGSGFPHSVTLDSPTASRPTTPKRRSINFLLTSSPKATPQVLDHQASQLILNALERTNSQQGSAKSPDSAKNGGSFGKSFTSMMGGLSSLSLARTSTRDSEDKDKDRGRSMLKMNRSKSSSQAPADEDRDSLQSVTRTRSQSPFSFRRSRNHEQSPAPQPVRLSQSDADLSDAPSSIHPRSTAFTDDDSGDGTDAEDDDASSSGDDRLFDPITERNTERNALITPVVSDVAGAAPEIEDPDPVGEGVNVIIAPEPYFPSSLNSSNSRGKRNPRRRKSVKTHEPLPFNTSRPVFQRDRCTITMTQGDPQGKLGGRRKRRYVVASDLSEESRYAVEWGVGTVLRDGDEMLIVTVVENEAKG